MIAQAGDTAQLTGKGGARSDTQNTSFSDQGDTDTPNVQPQHLDSRQSPQKTTPGMQAAVSGVFSLQMQLRISITVTVSLQTLQKEVQPMGVPGRI